MIKTELHRIFPLCAEFYLMLTLSQNRKYFFTPYTSQNFICNFHYKIFSYELGSVRHCNVNCCFYCKEDFFVPDKTVSYLDNLTANSDLSFWASVYPGAMLRDLETYTSASENRPEVK